MEPEIHIEKIFSKLFSSIDPKVLYRLKEYLLLLGKWSHKMNLVSSSDKNELIEKHFIPSFWFYEIIQSYNPKSILDIGSGAGFPGMILSILNPDWNIYMVESNRKKFLFLKEVSDVLMLNSNIINDRVENFKSKQNKAFEMIVSRSVASLMTLWSWSHEMLNENGVMFLLKGKNYKLEPDYKIHANFKIKEFEPSTKWIENSSILKNKLMLKLKRI